MALRHTADRELFAPGLPFALFSFPERRSVEYYYPDEDGGVEVVMHPFVETVESPVIRFQAGRMELSPDDLRDPMIRMADSGEGGHADDDLSREEYLLRLSRIIAELKGGVLDKVVFSRQKTLSKKVDVSALFLDLVSSYPTACVFLFRSAAGETWLAASPETLLQRDGAHCKTMSLAGTRTLEVDWTEKERVEQQIVTDYITSALDPVGVDGLQVHPTKDVQAGELFHLCSEITFDHNGPDDVVLDALHPTPAVCGRPMALARDSILSTEGYDRRYYSGYVGVRSAASSRYYVNLRSARVLSSSLILYAGGGITSDSDPVKEWEETERKLHTLERSVSRI